MDFIHQLCGNFTISRFSRGVLALSRNAKIRYSHRYTHRYTQWRRPISGFTLIIASIILGKYAHDLSRSDALWDWEQNHSPSSAVWTAALQARGFRQLNDPRLTQKVMRHLPANTDSAGSAWISEKWDWITLFDSEYHIYCLSCSEPATAWTPLGSGWAAFERAINGISTSGNTPKKVKQRPAADLDPREIRY